MDRVTLVVLLAVLTTSCAPRRWTVRVFPQCADQLPVQVLIDPGCPPDGICGYSCLPGRWGMKGR